MRSVNKKISAFRIGVCALFLIVAGLILSNYLLKSGNTDSRTASFLNPATAKEKLSPEQVNRLYDAHVIFYKEKVSTLYANMTITLILCIIGVIIIRRNEDIEIPGFPSLQIPIKISYLIVAGALCYYFLQFGFHLHDCVGIRIQIVKLIQAEYMTKQNLADVSGITFQEYFSYTPINTIKDVGFIDGWFIFFYPKYIPVSSFSTGAKALVFLTMLFVAILYGIAHGFALALPVNWIIRYHKTTKPYKRLAAALFFTIAGLLIISNFAFAQKNINWVNAAILISAALVFYFLTKKMVRDTHIQLKKPQSLKMNK